MQEQFLAEYYPRCEDCDIKLLRPANPIYLCARNKLVACNQLILLFRMKGVMATGNRKKKLEQMLVPNEKNRNFSSFEYDYRYDFN